MSTDRELLAAALHAIGQEDGSGRDCSICISDADALLPVVERIANEHAAAELDRMARWTVDTGYADAAELREFRDRAAALRAAELDPT